MTAMRRFDGMFLLRLVFLLRVVFLLGVVALLGACTATPLPTPPSASADSRRMELVERQAGQVALLGSAGAITPGGVRLRVTGPASAVERPVAEDGSFGSSLSGQRTDTFYLEVIEEPVTTFVLAVTGGVGTTVEEVLGTTDRDDDGSPDPIDSAPDDPDVSGRDCTEPAGCAPLAEVCNGLDDDGDGIIDDAACVCTENDSCGPGQECPLNGTECIGLGLSCDDFIRPCVGDQVCDPRERVCVEP